MVDMGKQVLIKDYLFCKNINEDSLVHIESGKNVSFMLNLG